MTNREEHFARQTFGTEPDDTDYIRDWLVDFVKFLLVMVSSAGLVLGAMAIAEALK